MHMYAYICIYMYICMVKYNLICMYVCISVGKCISICLYVCQYMCVYMYVYMSAYLHACTSISVYFCMCGHLHICVNILKCTLDCKVLLTCCFLPYHPTKGHSSQHSTSVEVHIRPPSGRYQAWLEKSCARLLSLSCL